MSQSTQCIVTVDPVYKTFELEGAIAERENAQIIIVNAGVPAASLEVGITERDTRYAVCDDFALDDDGNAVGIMNTNTTEMAALFTRYFGNMRRSMTLYVWDAVNDTLIATGAIDIINNPQSDDEPTEESASDYYTKAEANGRFLAIDSFADFDVEGTYTTRETFNVQTATIDELYEVVATMLAKLRG
ncbi:MAG: hypothetical protein EOM20_10465 [Spartobacteria bacterium]|nr:hypothetical protein [Spartobacteria bacterium]